MRILTQIFIVLLFVVVLSACSISGETASDRQSPQTHADNASVDDTPVATEPPQTSAASDEPPHPVVICMLDSGSNVPGATGWSFISDDDDISDEEGHGTRVHSLLSALAPDAENYMLKCFDEDMTIGDGSESGGEDAVVRALHAAVDDYGADIINMSWTVNAERPALYDAVRYAYESGAILVAPVGNLGLSTGLGAKTWPAAWDEVIGVGGVNLDESGEPVSSLAYLRSEHIFVCARADYEDEKGTSYAVPRVSAVIAKHIAQSREAQQDITHDDVLRMLKNAARDIGEPGYDTIFGWGYVD